MSPNADNAMARFLFAILKQKNLKDIDWNQVAQDPVLIQPITNGHAARMRYSRFRSTILGHEPNKRRSSSDDKSKISKSRKSSPSLKKENIIKSESSPSLSSYPHLSSASVSPYMDSLGDDFDTRFMTPGSDDLAQSLAIHPAALDYNNIEPSFLKQEPGLDDVSDFSAFEAAFNYHTYSQNVSDSSMMDSSNDWSQDPHF